MLESDEHPLDESLGNIHECALALELMGLSGWALKLAAAHENIQSYLIGNDEENERLKVRIDGVRKICRGYCDCGMGVCWACRLEAQWAAEDVGR